MTNEQRKTAIEWLQQEIRSLRLAPKINGCGPENCADLLEIMETCLEAVRGHGYEPLTLEQLRDMEGQPVWVQTPGIEKYGRWVIVAGVNIEDKALYCQGDYTCRDYGKMWIAYAYPPARIGRESWKPCGEMCRNNCMTCAHNADELFGDADYCKECHGYSKWESTVHKYCERCGRPKTPEAWADLEKRLRG